MSPARYIPPGETLLLCAHPHPLFIVLRSAGQTIGAVVAWLLARAALGWLGLEDHAPRATFALGAFLVLRLGWDLLEWLARWHVLTDRRVIRVGGVLRQYATDLPLASIQHFEVFRPLRERLLTLGSLGFATAGSGVVEVAWRTVANPSAQLAEVRRAAEAARRARAEGVEP